MQNIEGTKDAVISCNNKKMAADPRVAVMSPSVYSEFHGISPTPKDGQYVWAQLSSHGVSFKTPQEPEYDVNFFAAFGESLQGSRNPNGDPFETTDYEGNLVIAGYFMNEEYGFCKDPESNIYPTFTYYTKLDFKKALDHFGFTNFQREIISSDSGKNSYELVHEIDKNSGQEILHYYYVLDEGFYDLSLPASSKNEDTFNYSPFVESMLDNLNVWPCINGSGYRYNNDNLLLFWNYEILNADNFWYTAPAVGIRFKYEGNELVYFPTSPTEEMGLDAELEPFVKLDPRSPSCMSDTVDGIDTLIELYENPSELNDWMDRIAKENDISDTVDFGGKTYKHTRTTFFGIGDYYYLEKNNKGYLFTFTWDTDVHSDAWKTAVLPQEYQEILETVEFL